MASQSITIYLLSFREADHELYFPNVLTYSLNYTKENSAASPWFKLGYLKLIKEVKRQIAIFKPDILHAHYASSYGLVGALSGFKPFVISIWGSDIFEFPRKSIIHKMLMQFNLSRATYLQSTSKIMALEANKYISKKITVLPFGIDTSLFVPLEMNKLENDVFVIGTVKWLEEVYGINYLIQAFKLIVDKFPDKRFELLIVGSGSKLSEYKALVENLNIQDQTTFIGAVPVSETYQYHQRMSVFVALSLQESFGVSILEAEACGIPVVVSNVGGLPEVVLDQKTGYIVEPRNPMQAANAIAKLVENEVLRQQMGENARKFVQENYNWQSNVISQIKVYQQLK